MLAGVGPLARMDAGVTMEFPRVLEGSAADATAIRPLLSMNSPVNLQILLNTEHLVAIFALERSFARVCSVVTDEPRWHGEGLVADVAAVGIGGDAVRAGVGCQRAAGRQRQPAFPALVHTFLFTCRTNNVDVKRLRITHYLFYDYYTIFILILARSNATTVHSAMSVVYGMRRSGKSGCTYGAIKGRERVERSEERGGVNVLRLHVEAGTAVSARRSHGARLHVFGPPTPYPHRASPRYPHSPHFRFTRGLVQYTNIICVAYGYGFPN